MTGSERAVIPEGKRKIWVKTPTPNMIRHVPSGTYYFHGRVGKKQPVKKSLGTKIYAVAQRKLDDTRNALRLAATGRLTNDAPETLADALRIVQAQTLNKPTLKKSTRQTYLKTLALLAPGGAVAAPSTRLSRLTEMELQAWWFRTASAYSAQQANHCLMFAKRALKVALKCGSLAKDPAEELRPMKIPRRKLNLPTSDQFQSLLEHISMRESREWIEFTAYCGPRHYSEQRFIEWQHIDDVAGVIWIYGNPDNEGTKNRQPRAVPIIPQMAGLLRRMRRNRGGNPTGRLFTMTTGPRVALRTACKRIGIQPIQLRDLRHYFATQCAQSGVDVPTYAGWLGHQDGGILAAKTYTRPGHEHSQRSAQKVVC